MSFASCSIPKESDSTFSTPSHQGAVDSMKSQTEFSAVFVADLQEPSASYRNSGFALTLKESRLENN